MVGETNPLYDDKFPGKTAPPDSLDFRIGGDKKRSMVYDIVKKWNRLHPEGFRVSVVDVWMLTDNFPESTFDGRHWAEEDSETLGRRPHVGQADGISRNNVRSDVI